MLLALLFACAPGKPDLADTEDDTSLATVGDTAEDTGAGTDTAADTGADTGEGTDTGAETGIDTGADTACEAPVAWHADADQDGFGAPAVVAIACEAPAGTVADGTDCDDADADAFPGAPEAWYDGVDQACDGGDDWDRDGDGHRAASEGDDCDDLDADVNPDAREACGDGVDGDCDGLDRACVDRALGTGDVALRGIAEDDNAGVRFAAPGDVDGDGADDLLVAGPAAAGGATFAGEVYLLRGPLSGTIGLEDADATLLGEADEDAFGWGLAAMEDRVAVGSLGADRYRGVVYVMGLPSSGDASAGDAEATVHGEEELDRFGAAVAAVGDVDGDGEEDLLTGAYTRVGAGGESGMAYLLSGPFSGTLAAADATARMAGDVGSDDAGFAVAAACDADGDGTPDLLVGAPDTSWSYATTPGTAWLVPGPVAGDVALASVGHALTGADVGDGAGWAVGGCGDVDGDGYGDVAVGAPGHGIGGAAYVVRGPIVAGASLAAADAVLIAAAAGDGVGASVAIDGDYDGDGRADLVVGATGQDAGGTSAGAAYVVLAPVAGTLDLAVADARLTGTSAYDYAGYVVGAAGDLDGDGAVDLFVGAPSTYSTTSHGTAYVVAGGGVR